MKLRVNHYYKVNSDDNTSTVEFTPTRIDAITNEVDVNILSPVRQKATWDLSDLLVNPTLEHLQDETFA